MSSLKPEGGIKHGWLAGCRGFSCYNGICCLETLGKIMEYNRLDN